MTAPLTPQKETRFKLEPLDRDRESRRKLRRWASVAATLGTLMTLSTLSAVVLTTSAQRGTLVAYWVVAATGLTVVLTLGVLLIAARYNAPPPVSVRVSRKGLAFEFSNRDMLVLGWPSDPPGFVLTVRPLVPAATGSREYRLSYRRSGDVRRFWRPVLPLTYLTRDAFEGILSVAIDSGLRVESSPNARELVTGQIDGFGWFSVLSPQ